MKWIVPILVLLIAVDLLLAQLAVMTAEISNWVVIVLVAVIGILLLLRK